MPSRLATKSIILTGSQVVMSVKQLITQHGGKVFCYPLIETVEKVTKEEQTYLRNLKAYCWLIFTSQNAVKFFVNKLERHKVSLPKHIKIAAVGEKTAALLNQHGLTIDFMPTIYSADVFIQEFELAANERALFLRGSMAKSTIHDGTGADEWTVYETKPCNQYVEDLKACVLNEVNPIVIFASPSAVDMYAQKVVPDVAWEQAKYASIGHITTAALQRYGVVPIVQPKIYTMQAVIEQLILEESST